MNRNAVHSAALNAICPYFTMFPLDFPKRVLDRYAKKGQRVLDPFCGRGTTNFAARLAGLESVGIDSSPVAIAVTKAKLIRCRPEKIVAEARSILAQGSLPDAPQGTFWRLAFHPAVLRDLCKLRNSLLVNCNSPERIALRAIMLGALHGPLQKSSPAYFSNQCPRTYAPKPAYAVKYWKYRNMLPPVLDVVKLIRTRATRYFAQSAPKAYGNAVLGDSRDPVAFKLATDRQKFDWVITSPPYYGMRTYIPDQWLRNWFVGGPGYVDYTNAGQINHISPDVFIQQLSQVWQNVAGACRVGARLVIRFGGIRDRKANPLDLIKRSLCETPWKLVTRCDAGTSHRGKRQADSFLRSKSKPIVEYDLWATI